MTRVLVCGGRNYDDHLRVAAVLNRLHNAKGISLIIQGGARGADELAFGWARANGIEEIQFDADWENQGSFAGPARNKRMLDEGKPDLVIAFPGGRGTADMVRKARRAGVEVVEISHG
jgi:predicted Rossmann-fold nucleotide-binding protein